MAATQQSRLIIPDDHTVVRYCMPSTLDPESKQVLSVAFARKAAETTVSVNDLDLAEGGTASEKLSATKRMMLLKLKPNGKFALLPVASVRVVKALPRLDVIHDPDEKDGRRNDAHCGITNAPTEDDASNSVLLELRDVVTAEHFVRDV
jgi:hypothetical protein